VGFSIEVGDMDSGDFPPASGDVFRGSDTPPPAADSELGFENTDIGRLRQMWRDEKYAPELLPMDNVVIENINEQLDFQDDLIRNEKEEDLDESPEAAADPDRAASVKTICAIELDRLRYILRDYLRIRLWKLAEYPQHYLEKSNQMLLSEAERIYVKGLWEAQEGLLHNRFLSALPKMNRRLDTQEDLLDLVRRPDLDRHVYIKVLQDIGFVISVSLTQSTQDSEITPSATRQQDLTLTPGHTYNLKYRHIRQLLMNPEHRGKICLV
jgi:GINS complex subunit 4